MDYQLAWIDSQCEMSTPPGSTWWRTFRFFFRFSSGLTHVRGPWWCSLSDVEDPTITIKQDLEDLEEVVELTKRDRHIIFAQVSREPYYIEPNL